MIRTSIPLQVLTHDKDFALDKIEFSLETNPSNNKPYTALWTCDFQENVEDVGWINWNLNWFKSYIKSNLYHLVPKNEKFNIYEISSLDDLTDIPYIEIYEERVFDYKKLKEEGYDGLHITQRGANLGHRYDGSVPFEVVNMMNGFDCESTVWFNTDWIEEVKCVDPDFKSTFAKLASVYD